MWDALLSQLYIGIVASEALSIAESIDEQLKAQGLNYTIDMKQFRYALRENAPLDMCLPEFLWKHLIVIWGQFFEHYQDIS